MSLQAGLEAEVAEPAAAAATGAQSTAHKILQAYLSRSWQTGESGEMDISPGQLFFSFSAGTVLPKWLSNNFGNTGLA